MDKHELLQLLNGYEWVDVEFKAARENVPKYAWSRVKKKTEIRKLFPLSAVRHFVHKRVPACA